MYNTIDVDYMLNFLCLLIQIFLRQIQNLILIIK